MGGEDGGRCTEDWECKADSSTIKLSPARSIYKKVRQGGCLEQKVMLVTNIFNSLEYLTDVFKSGVCCLVIVYVCEYVRIRFDIS